MTGLGNIINKPFLSWLRGYIKLKDGTKLRLDLLSKNNISPACELLLQSSKQSVGIGKDEFTLRETVTQQLIQYQEQQCIYEAVDTDSGILAGTCFIYPCPFARSLSSVLNGGHSVIDLRYQSKGIAQYTAQVIIAAALKDGFSGMCTRVSLINNRAISTSLKNKTVVTGFIPQSVFLADKGWCEDIVFHLDYSNIGLENVKKAKEIMEEEAINRAYNTTRNIHSDPIRGRHLEEVTLPDNKPALIKSASQSADFKTGFDLLNQAVQAGDGFAVDEFPSLELFQSHFLAGREMLLLQREDGVIAAVAVVGSSRLCRSSGGPSSTLYMYVKPVFRRKGYGTFLLRYIEGYLRNQGYSSVIIDAFINDSIHDLLKKQGYTGTGLIPLSGFIKGRGLCDCVIYHKNINLMSSL